MDIPISRGTMDGLTQLLPSLKAPPLEGRRAQHFPPRFDHVQIGSILGLEDELPAEMAQSQTQHIGGMVCAEVVQDDVDPLGFARQSDVDLLQKVHKMSRGATRIGCRQRLACGRLESAKDIALTPSPVIDLLPGTLSGLSPVRLMHQHPLQVALAASGPISSMQTVTSPSGGVS